MTDLFIILLPILYFMMPIVPPTPISFPFWADKLTYTFTVRCAGLLTASFSSSSESISDSKSFCCGNQPHPFLSLYYPWTFFTDNFLFSAILTLKNYQICSGSFDELHSFQLILGVPTPYKRSPPIGSMSQRHIIMLEVKLEWLTGSWEHRSVCKQNAHVSSRYTGRQCI